MNLDTFEDEIDSPLILSRGFSYYRGKSVLSLEMHSPNHYKAHVAGTQLYEVMLTLDDNREIEEMSCTCPYDWGEHCKHEVAVLYALRHQLDRGQHETVERPKDVDLTNLLEKRSKEELLSFLLAFSKESPPLVSALIAAFPSSSDDVNLKNLGIEFRRACEHGIESTQEDDRYGWNDEEDDWQFTTELHKKIGELIMMARVAINEGRIRYGVSIAAMMAHEISSLDEYEGETLEDQVKDAVMQIVALFDEVTLKSDDASWVFSQFFPATKKYQGPGEMLLLKLCIRFAETEEDQNVLENYLVSLASDETDDEEEDREALILNSLKLQHTLLLKRGMAEEAQRFALEKLSYEGIRKLAFDHALETKDFSLAERLVKQNEESDYRTFGAIDWSLLLFRVYQESGNTSEMRSLAKEFLLHDDLSYYPKLKASYDENEWGEVLDSLLDELERRSDEKSSSVYRKNPYPEVLKAEAKYKRLLMYIQKNPRLVQSYQDVLLPTYKDAVFELYRKNILSDGEAATSRNAYKALALLLKELVVIGGGSVAGECLVSLEPRYNRRSAMRDEIEKVGLL